MRLPPPPAFSFSFHWKFHFLIHIYVHNVTSFVNEILEVLFQFIHKTGEYKHIEGTVHRNTIPCTLYTLHWECECIVCSIWYQPGMLVLFPVIPLRNAVHYIHTHICIYIHGLSFHFKRMTPWAGSCMCRWSRQTHSAPRTKKANARERWWRDSRWILFNREFCPIAIQHTLHLLCTYAYMCDLNVFVYQPSGCWYILLLDWVHTHTVRAICAVYNFDDWWPIFWDLRMKLVVGSQTNMVALFDVIEDLYTLFCAHKKSIHRS